MYLRFLAILYGLEMVLRDVKKPSDMILFDLNLILDPLLVFLLSQHLVTIEQQGADQGSDFIQNFLTRHV